MGTSATKAKNRYNAANYTQVKVNVEPDIAAAFKADCQAEGVSMASELTKYMTSRCNGPSAGGKTRRDLLMSRGGRRKMIAALIGQLEEIREAEEGYRDRIPANLCGSQAYEDAEQSIGAIQEALDALYEAY